MNETALIKLALDLGFADAAISNTKELVFVPNFRTLCEENLCGKYGVNDACPPDCGTVEQIQEKVLHWRQAPGITTFFSMYCFDADTRSPSPNHREDPS